MVYEPQHRADVCVGRHYAAEHHLRRIDQLGPAGVKAVGVHAMWGEQVVVDRWLAPSGADIAHRARIGLADQHSARIGLPNARLVGGDQPALQTVQQPLRPARRVCRDALGVQRLRHLHGQIGHRRALRQAAAAATQTVRGWRAAQRIAVNHFVAPGQGISTQRSTLASVLEPAHLQGQAAHQADQHTGQPAPARLPEQHQFAASLGDPAALVRRRPSVLVEAVEVHLVAARSEKRQQMRDGHLIGARHGQREPRTDHRDGHRSIRRRHRHTARNYHFARSRCVRRWHALKPVQVQEPRIGPQLLGNRRHGLAEHD